MTATGAPAARELARDEPIMSIGEVLARLLPEFPDVTISKLRFLEAEGLVEPLRAASGYRKYTPEHVERLRFVLAAQRDRYLPLRVIREQIEAIGDRVVGPPESAPRPGPAHADVVDSRLTRAQLAERSGLDDAGLTDLEQYGLLARSADGTYGGDALTVARIGAQLAKYGLEGRHLRAYRATADREVGLLAQLVTPLARQPGLNTRAKALETVYDLSALCAQMHAALVSQGLRQVMGA